MSELIDKIKIFHQQIIELEKQNDEALLVIDSLVNFEEIMKIMLILDIPELDIVRRSIITNSNRSYYKPYSHFKKLNIVCKMLQDLQYNSIDLNENIKTETVDKFFKSIKKIYETEIEEYGYPSYNPPSQKSDNVYAILPKDTDKNIHKILEDNIDTIHQIEITLPEEITQENASNLIEGVKKQIIVNAYERSSQAKKECILKYGYKCTICNFDFEKIYGEIGKSFIHVHHLKPLSEIDEEYEINPLTDLRPVCPNCHAMLHKRNPVYSIEEIQNFVNKKNL